VHPLTLSVRRTRRSGHLGLFVHSSVASAFWGWKGTGKETRKKKSVYFGVTKMRALLQRPEFR